MRAGAWAIALAFLAGCGRDAPPAPPPEAATARAAAEEWKRGRPLEGADAAAADLALARAEQALAAGSTDPAAFRDAGAKYKDAIVAREVKREALYRDALDARSKARALRTRLTERQNVIVAAAAASGDQAEIWTAVREIADRDVFKSEKLLSIDVALERADALFSAGHHAESRDTFATAEAGLDAFLVRLSEAEAEAHARAALQDAELAVAAMRRSVGRPAPASAERAEAALDAGRRAVDKRDFPRAEACAREATDLAAQAKGYRAAVETAKTGRAAAKLMLDKWLEVEAPENDASRAGRERFREGEEALESDPAAASDAFRAAAIAFREAIAAGQKERKARLSELRTKNTQPPLPPDPLDSRKTAEAVRLALEWLARHQDDDGRWSSADFIRHDPAGAARADVGGVLHDAGVTGLALLCFLSAGYSDRGEGDKAYYAVNVEQALRFLRLVQSDDGVFGTRATHSFMYNHAIATIAMAEAARITGDAGLRKSAEIAVRYIEHARNSGGAWRYEPGSGQNDTSVTLWCVEALAAAEAAGIAVDPAAYRGALAWIDSATDGGGRTGYDRRGSLPARLEGAGDRFPSSRSEAMTAAGILIRVLAGETPRNEDAIRLGTKLIFDQPPAWSPAAGSIDMYYWRAATRALRLSRCPRWLSWSSVIQGVALRWQVPSTGAHNAGSWDPIGAWGKEGGRIYSTAMMTLALIESAKAAP
ncbi:MAG TPA: hypothetical protein VFY93_17155 [Planctomycetota bacterium]|nr:hypothetical protein [Planctomycetota bacterium]